MNKKYMMGTGDGGGKQRPPERSVPAPAKKKSSK